MYENELTDSRYITEGSRPDAMRWLLAAAEQGLPRAQIKARRTYAPSLTSPRLSVKACHMVPACRGDLRAATLRRPKRRTSEPPYVDAGSDRRGQAIRRSWEPHPGHYRIGDVSRLRFNSPEDNNHAYFIRRRCAPIWMIFFSPRSARSGMACR